MSRPNNSKPLTKDVRKDRITDKLKPLQANNLCTKYCTNRFSFLYNQFYKMKCRYLCTVLRCWYSEINEGKYLRRVVRLFPELRIFKRKYYLLCCLKLLRAKSIVGRLRIFKLVSVKLQYHQIFKIGSIHKLAKIK